MHSVLRIRDLVLFDFGIRDEKNPDPGSDINILDHISYSLSKKILLKNTQILCCGSGSRIRFFTLDLR